MLILLVIGVLLGTTGTLPRADTEPELAVAFLDVGQGDAILLTTPGEQQILIDGGPDATILTRLGEEMPFYDHTIELVIASHNDADHITGLISVLERYTVEKLWINGAIHTTQTYMRLLETVRDRQVPTEVVWSGQSDTKDGVVFEVLYPTTSQEGVRPKRQNDLSLIVRADYNSQRFLFTGDIDEKVEQDILKSGASLSATVLKVPHHGSASGLALNFLQAIKPKYAVIQVGKENKFGHPAASILEKLLSAGAVIYRTDEQGTIHMRTNGDTLTIEESSYVSQETDL